MYRLSAQRRRIAHYFRPVVLWSKESIFLPIFDIFWSEFFRKKIRHSFLPLMNSAFHKIPRKVTAFLFEFFLRRKDIFQDALLSGSLVIPAVREFAGFDFIAASLPHDPTRTGRLHEETEENRSRGRRIFKQVESEKDGAHNSRWRKRVSIENERSWRGRFVICWNIARSRSRSTKWPSMSSPLRISSGFFHLNLKKDTEIGREVCLVWK